METFGIIKDIGLSGLVDIFLMSLLLYVTLVWFKRKRALFVLTGILIIGVIYLISYQFNLFLISSVLRAFFAVILIAVIVIFQEELKYFFEQIAVWSFDTKFQIHRVSPLQNAAQGVEILVRSLHDMARDRIGVLIVVKGRSPLMRHLDGGVDLDGEMSIPLIKSIFDPNSMGHDGAMLVDKDRVIQFAAHLPLSKNFSKLGQGGTRHAAALGLAELSDALCLVVSEEKGTISVARNGNMFEVKDPELLTKIIRDFYEETNPREKRGLIKEIFVRNYKEKLIAVLLTLALWFVLVQQSRLIQKSYSVEIQYPGLSSDLVIKDIEPKEVMVTFSGTRNAFFFVNDKNLRLSLKLGGLRDGLRMITLTEANLNFPKELSLESIEPRRIKVHLEKQEIKLEETP